MEVPALPQVGWTPEEERDRYSGVKPLRRHIERWPGRGEAQSWRPKPTARRRAWMRSAFRPGAARLVAARHVTTSRPKVPLAGKPFGHSESIPMLDTRRLADGPLPH